MSVPRDMPTAARSELPAIGLGTFVAQWLLRRPLIAANTREFHSTGSCDDPKVERVERKPDDATAAGQPTPTE